MIDRGMKARILLLLVLVIFIGSNLASADFIQVTCTCECRGETITATGMYPKKLLELEETEIENAKKECHKQCAATCGGYSDCSTTCADCCSDHCTTKYSDSEDEYKDKCIESCKSKCDLKETINKIAEIIYYIAGIIVAIMFIINGYKFITSTTPEDRDDAKKGIIYIILALIIIIIAMPLTNLLIDAVRVAPSTVIKIEVSNALVNNRIFSCDIRNIDTETLTNTVVTVTMLDVTCIYDEVHSENLGSINPGGSKSYLYDNFCADPRPLTGNPVRYEINFQSDQGSRIFCVTFSTQGPGDPGSVSGSPC